MKKIKQLLFAVLFLFFCVNYASAYPSLNAFTIQGQYLRDGKLYAATPGSPTPFTADFFFTKSGETYNTVQVSLVLISSSGESTVSNVITRFDGDWVISNSNIWQATISGTLPANQTSGSIYLKMTVYEGSTQGATTTSTTSYAIYTVPTGGGGGVPSRELTNSDYNKRYIPADHNKQFTNANGDIAIAYNGNYRMMFQIDGNMVLYNGTNPIWASRTTGGIGRVTWLYGGGVVIDFDNGSRAWSAGTQGSPRPIWVMQDDGNFVGYINYSVDANDIATITPSPFAGTSTAGGKKSGRSGSLK